MSLQTSGAPDPWLLLEISPACQNLSHTGESPLGLTTPDGATQMPNGAANLFPQSSGFSLANVVNVWLVIEGCTACSSLTCPRTAQSILAELLPCQLVPHLFSCIRFILSSYNSAFVFVTFCEVLVGLLLQPAEPPLIAVLVSRLFPLQIDVSLLRVQSMPSSCWRWCTVSALVLISEQHCS